MWYFQQDLNSYWKPYELVYLFNHILLELVEALIELSLDQSTHTRQFPDQSDANSELRLGRGTIRDGLLIMRQCCTCLQIPKNIMRDTVHPLPPPWVWDWAGNLLRFGWIIIHLVHNKMLSNLKNVDVLQFCLTRLIPGKSKDGCYTQIPKYKCNTLCD